MKKGSSLVDYLFAIALKNANVL